VKQLFVSAKSPVVLIDWIGMFPVPLTVMVTG